MHIDLRSTTARRRAAAALVAGPLVTVAGMAATPWESEQTTASYQAALAASPIQGQVSAILLVFGYALIGLAVATVLLHAGRAPRKLKIAAGILGFCGATIMPGIVSVDFYDLALAQSLPQDTAVEVAEKAGSYGLQPIIMIPAMLGFVLGPITALFAAWKAQLTGLWAPLAVIAGMVVSIAVFSGITMVLAALVMVAAFGSIARTILRGDAVAVPVGVVPAAA